MRNSKAQRKKPTSGLPRFCRPGRVEAVPARAFVGTQVRFLSTVEGSNILRIGDRQGTVLPANSVSGGKAILAELDREVLEQLFRTNNADISGAAIHAPAGVMVGAKSVAIPTTCFRKQFDAGPVREVFKTRKALEADLGSAFAG